MTEAADKGLAASDLELWRGDRRLFTGISFQVEFNQYLLITGANGCGKTSLLRMLCGFTLPEAGEVRWNGNDIAADRYAYHPDLVYVGHEEGQKADLTARENLMHWARLRTGVTLDRIDAALERVGLDPANPLQTRFLSAGMRRRLALARLPLGEVRLWLLDEPLTHLDHEGRELVAHLIEDHVAAGGCAVIATHQELSVSTGGGKSLELG